MLKKAAFHRKRKKLQETERHRTQVSPTLDTRCAPARQEENTRRYDLRAPRTREQTKPKKIRPKTI